MFQSLNTFSKLLQIILYLLLVIFITACNSEAGTELERILYIGPDLQGQNQLFATPLVNGLPRQITKAEFGIMDYELSPMGQSIVYTALREDGGTNLRQVSLNGRSDRQLLDCTESTCNWPVWSPDGKRLVYSRLITPHTYQLWWFDMETSQTEPVFEGTQETGFSARWSPDGKWLNYVSPVAHGIGVYNVEDGSSYEIHSQMGEPARWSPDGSALLFTDVAAEAERFSMQLLKFNLQTEEIINLSQSVLVDDGWPIWSNSGAYIAFGRKAPQIAMGKQLWRMRADGSEATHLTDETDIHHIPLAWSSDDRYLLYRRFPFKDASARPSVWVLDTETGESWEVAQNSQQASWLP